LLCPFDLVLSPDLVLHYTTVWEIRQPSVKWSAIEALPDPEPQPDPKRPSKQDVVIAMLRQPEGATVDEVASVTGWQRHTVRGVFSGTLKKKLGLTLASAKEERGRVYRIAEPTSL
jgi:Protein of unknown function (DUF3489)